jgi:glycosyltransferase involved in cell wall biosynthesis
MRFLSLGEPARLREAGTLYRPDPGIPVHAWHRHRLGLNNAYSIVGITHTIASHQPMTAIAELARAPVQDWDALICTTSAARAAVRRMIDNTIDDLRERLGATRLPAPQLPIIPIGIHTRDFAHSDAARATARTNLGLTEDDVAILFVGRLIFHGKAHPLPMYLALEQAARDVAATGKRCALILAGIAPTQGQADVFRAEAAQFAPSVRTVLVDGNDRAAFDGAWACADIFTSLVDNFQETQGLTPIEAMAAGLPMVISDWDGYRDLIRDGEEGYLIPTLTLPPGSGYELADRYDLAMDNYDHYTGYLSQLVSVDIGAAASAYARLIRDPNLRRRLGEAGRRRAREVFDWSVIWPRYEALFLELEARRLASPPRRLETRRARSDRDDPFSVFAEYPTSTASPDTRFRYRPGVTREEALARRSLGSTRFANVVQPTPADIEKILAKLGDDAVTLAELGRSTGIANRRLMGAVVWLTKIGVLEHVSSFAAKSSVDAPL